MDTDQTLAQRIEARRYQLAIYRAAYAETYGRQLNAQRNEADDPILSDLRRDVLAVGRRARPAQPSRLPPARPMSARATQVVKGRTLVDVTVIDAEDHDEALEVALAAAGETRGSLFGWRVGTPDEAGVRTVTLHTD